MTTTLTTLRQEVSKLIGDYKASTITTSHATDPRDSTLAEYPNDAFNDWYMIPTAGTYAGVVRKISDFVQTNGVITVYSTFGGATGTVAYELHKFNPEDIRLKINQAVQELYPGLWVPLIDEWSLITNNILPNALPATWTSSSTPDKWTVTGLTASQATTASLLRVGTSGLKMISTGSAQTVMCTNSENKYLSDLAGKSITLKAWVYSTDASKVALRLYDTAESLSSYHAGDSKWHLLTLSETLAKDPTNVSLAFGYYIASTTITAYAQQARITGINVQRYLLPTAFKKINNIFLQTTGNIDFTADTGLAICDSIHQDCSWRPISSYNWYIEDDGTDKWLIFKVPLPDERRLKLVGEKYGSTLSTESGTVEFDAPQVNLIAAKAAALLLEQYASDPAYKNQKADFILGAQMWNQRARELQYKYSVSRPARMVW